MRKLAFYENAGTVFWYLLDGAWLLKWDFFALIMIIPALMCNILVFRYIPKNYNALTMTAAINMWLAMNAIWIFADLKGMNSLLLPAKILFFVGMALMLSIIIRNPSKQNLSDALQYFRRFRLHKS